MDIQNDGIHMKVNKHYVICLFFLLCVFAANHIEYHFRKRSLSDKSKNTGTVIVKSENVQMGHATLGIDEDASSWESGKTILHFSTLGAWDFDPQKNNTCPESIKEISGRNVSCIGFMYPLEAGSKIKLFALLRTTQTCCYGPRPQYNQYIFVELREPVKFERLHPVIVDGVFFVDPKPDEGYIYRLEANTATRIRDDVPDINAAEAAEKANLPLFDFSLLEIMKSSKDKTHNTNIPSQLSMLKNNLVVVEGFLVGSTEDIPPKQIVGKYWWDGVMKGTPPDLYNAIMVFPKDESQVAPAWKQKVIFTGMLKVTKDMNLYTDNGIISIRDAVRGIPGQNPPGYVFNAGLFLKVWHEVIILGVFFIQVLRKSGVLRRRRQSTG